MEQKNKHKHKQKHKHKHKQKHTHKQKHKHMTSSSARTPAAPARSADVTYGARTAGDCKENILVMLIVMLVVAYNM